jgi:hypothetical protein
MDVAKGDYRINSNNTFVDYKKTAMDLPPVTSVVFLIAN